jgi:hypothetical protein
MHLRKTCNPLTIRGLSVYTHVAFDYYACKTSIYQEELCLLLKGLHSVERWQGVEKATGNDKAE